MPAYFCNPLTDEDNLRDEEFNNFKQYYTVYGKPYKHFGFIVKWADNEKFLSSEKAVIRACLHIYENLFAEDAIIVN